MSSITKPYTFSAGAVIVASEHNSNFDTIYSDYNGNITNVNIASGAAISDTKLAQITTASKVSTSAITGTLGPTFGGTGIATYTQGDILYSSAADTLAKLGAGTSGQLLMTLGAGANPVYAGVEETVDTSSSDETTTSTSYTDTTLSVAFTSSGGFAFVTFTGEFALVNLNGNNATMVAITDGSNNIKVETKCGYDAAVPYPVTLTFFEKVAAGSYTYKVRFKVGNGAGTIHLHGDYSTARLKVVHF